MAEDASLVYTHARWDVLPGQEDAFVAAWTRLAATFSALPGAPLWGTLIQSADDPTCYHSFGPWRSEADVAAMRADPAAQRAMAELRMLCRSATPGLHRRVRHVDVATSDPGAAAAGTPAPAAPNRKS